MKGGALANSEVVCDLLPVIADDPTSLEYGADGPGLRPISDGLRRDADALREFTYSQVSAGRGRGGDFLVWHHRKNLRNRAFE